MVTMTPCNEWHLAPMKNGYGQVKRGGKVWKAHRYVWTMHNGPIPDGLMVLHSCDNRMCVNLDHLRLGTHEDNMRDMADRGRALGRGPLRVYPRGQQHHNAKLTDAERVAIVARSASTSQQRLADEYGVSQTLVSQLIRKARAS